MGGGALDEDQNHDIVAYCLPRNSYIWRSLYKALKIINLAAYITNLLFFKDILRKPNCQNLRVCKNEN